MAMLSSFRVLALCALVHAQPVVNGQAVAVVGQPALTPCQRCCAPGGDCSTAFKGAAGKCCGVMNGQAFCCPGAAGQQYGGAKCYSCSDSYRCFTGFAAPNICGGRMPVPRMQRLPYDQQRDPIGFNELLVMIAIAGVVFLLCCNNRRHDYHEAAMMPQYGPGSAMQPVGLPVGPGGYPVHGGYGCPVGGYGGGMGVAGGAATGFLGGMLVSDMMHSASHHHGDYGGGYGGGYGGDYGGGGGDFGGGGGDGGFASDS